MLSVLITARDEEEQLPGALASIAGVASETVVVLDPRTQDRSRETAERVGARVLEHPYASSATQCNWGIEQCTYPWVFVLDSDERLTEPLRAAIATVLKAPRHPAYSVRRYNFAFGRRQRFGDWGRDRVVRLIDRRAASFDDRSVHGSVRAASVGRLAGVLQHDTLRSLEQYLPKVYDYARRGSADLVAAGKRAHAWTVFSHAEWAFVRSFLIRLGLLDGLPGFIVAVLIAHQTFIKWAGVWQATAAAPRRPQV